MTDYGSALLSICSNSRDGARKGSLHSTVEFIVCISAVAKGSEQMSIISFANSIFQSNRKRNPLKLTGYTTEVQVKTKVKEWIHCLCYRLLLDLLRPAKMSSGKHRQVWAGLLHSIQPRGSQRYHTFTATTWGWTRWPSEIPSNLLFCQWLPVLAWHTFDRN